MLKNVLYVAVGGALGSVIRYLFSFIFPSTNFPTATFIVNAIGCFIIGLLMGYFLKHQANSSFETLMVVGLCGGFTTFSAFSYQTVMLLQQQKITLALLYIFLSVITCIVLCAAGLWCTK